MADLESLFDRAIFSAEYSADLRGLFQVSRILILVDGDIQVTPFYPPIQAVPASTEFGISVAIGVVKQFAQGFASFHVTVATRNGDGSPIDGHDITGFRFSAEALANFDQVWMFGFEPGNPTTERPVIDDSDIEKPEHHPLSDDELAALAQWMDRGGGVFAAGDHHVLGASMCHKVPRVAAMRAWTEADAVPTKFGPTRYMTTRPAGADQTIGDTAIPPYDNEEDSIPQPIEWVEFRRLLSLHGPHPLLCHPQLGVINIMPDHMHEGRCFDPADPDWIATKRDLTFDFAGYANQHFPQSGGVRPLPQLVAWGFTPASPPLRYENGPQPYRRFPDISVYDGQRIGIGRVVVQSTWHHWFDLNLAGLIAGAAWSGDRKYIDKIERYFVNVGIYLASARWRAAMTMGILKLNQLGFFGQQVINLGEPAREIGRATKAFLVTQLGPCWINDLIGDILGESVEDLEAFDAVLARSVENPAAIGGDAIAETVLGEIVRAAYGDMAELQRQVSATGQARSSPLSRTMHQAIAEAAAKGLHDAIEAHLRDLDAARKDLDTIRRKPARAD